MGVLAHVSAHARLSSKTKELICKASEPWDNFWTFFNLKNATQGLGAHAFEGFEDERKKEG